MDDLYWVVGKCETVAEALDCLGIVDPAKSGIIGCPEATVAMVERVWQEVQSSGGGTGAFCWQMKRQIRAFQRRQEVARRLEHVQRSQSDEP